MALISLCIAGLLIKNVLQNQKKSSKHLYYARISPNLLINSFSFARSGPNLLEMGGHGPISNDLWFNLNKTQPKWLPNFNGMIDKSCPAWLATQENGPVACGRA